MRTVRVGVIGVGVLGRHHARLYRDVPGARLVGIYDASMEAARAVALELGTAVYPSPAALAAEVEAVSVAVPTDLHYEVVAPLLAMGKHVLVEKPIAATGVEARRLVSLAARRHLVLQVGHVERYNAALGGLASVPGRPLFIDAQRLAPYPPARPGARPRGTEVGVVLDLMIHDIDIVLDLVRSPIRRVEAVGAPVLSETEDIANARLTFASGCVANLTASRVSEERVRRLRVFKPDSYVTLDLQDRKACEAATRHNGQIVRYALAVPDTNALLEELEDFCHCVRSARTACQPARPRVDGEAGLAALLVAERIRRCIAKGPGARPRAD